MNKFWVKIRLLRVFILHFLNDIFFELWRLKITRKIFQLKKKNANSVFLRPIQYIIFITQKLDATAKNKFHFWNQHKKYAD